MRSYSRWSAVGALLLASCGGGDSPTPVAAPAGATTPVTTPAPAPTPAAPATVAISANALAVTAGGTVTLTWNSTGATGCTASGGWNGSKAASGTTTTAAITIATTYSLVCTGAGGASAPAGVTVNVVPTAALTVTPATVSPGSSAVLNWSSSNATACTASGGWSGAKATSGSQSTGPLSAPTSYSIVCNGAGGTSHAVTVTVISGAVTVTPTLAALTVGQTQPYMASVSGGGALAWSVDGVAGGNSTVGQVTSSGVYTAGTAAGTHTVTATSVAYPSLSGSASAAVTDLGGVLTYHNDLARDGVNASEFALTPAALAAGQVGKIFSCAVDGAIYGQPLWVAGLTIGGARHNVVFVATEHDSLYAFDGDAGTCSPLWSVSLLDAAHGATSGETPVPSGTSGFLVGRGAGDLAPEVGVTGTPVIDPVSGTLFAVAKSVSANQATFFQRLHAIDLATGLEKSGAPALIAATYPGSGDGGTTVAFDPRAENQRAALTWANGTVYIAWAAHEDAGLWYGWVMGYSYGPSGLAQAAVFNAAPDGQSAGIWMSGGGAAVDSSGTLYVITGNGNFNAVSTTPPQSDYGDSLLKLTPSLKLSQYFTPSNQATDSAGDKDFGAGGAAVLADLPAPSPVAHALICGGKDGTVYLLNRDALGGYGDSAAIQKVAFGYRVFATAALWNSQVYLAGDQGPLVDYSLSAAGPALTQAAASTHLYGFGGSTPSVSAAGTTGGVVWALDNASFCLGTATACGPTVLHAYDASNVASELWNSGTVAADSAGNAVKFTVPTVANGRVYVGTRGNNTGGAAGSTSINGELDVYGLKP